MVSEKQKNIFLVLVILTVIVISLFFAYQNGVIGKAIIGSLS